MEQESELDLSPPLLPVGAFAVAVVAMKYKSEWCTGAHQVSVGLVDEQDEV